MKCLASPRFSHQGTQSKFLQQHFALRCAKRACFSGEGTSAAESVGVRSDETSPVAKRKSAELDNIIEHTRRTGDGTMREEVRMRFFDTIPGIPASSGSLLSNQKTAFPLNLLRWESEVPIIRALISAFGSVGSLR